MNSDLQLLQPYPFEKLRALLAGAVGNPDLSPVSLSIGEPKHEAPGFVLDTLAREMGQYSVYPTTAGVPALRQAIVDW
ncbi:MAG: succinyldiaminopimelate transaminase, partial [Pseudomonas formosensis]|nr:succinyldiaminopimelate transaminase [Halopseudomonas formosensis]